MILWRRRFFAASLSRDPGPDVRRNLGGNNIRLSFRPALELAHSDSTGWSMVEQRMPHVIVYRYQICRQGITHATHSAGQ